MNKKTVSELLLGLRVEVNPSNGRIELTKYSPFGEFLFDVVINDKLWNVSGYNGETIEITATDKPYQTRISVNAEYKFSPKKSYGNLDYTQVQNAISSKLYQFMLSPSNREAAFEEILGVDLLNQQAVKAAFDKFEDVLVGK